jgi:hypothetical protein
MLPETFANPDTAVNVTGLAKVRDNWVHGAEAESVRGGLRFTCELMICPFGGTDHMHP